MTENSDKTYERGATLHSARECDLCKKRGKTWEGSDPACAFQGGFFSPDNWNCATANGVRDIADAALAEDRLSELVYARRHDDQSACYISVAHIELESGNADGLFVGWYKNRGRTESMWLLGSEEPRRPTENDCVAIIGGFQAISST